MFQCLYLGSRLRVFVLVAGGCVGLLLLVCICIRLHVQAGEASNLFSPSHKSNGSLRIAIRGHRICVSTQFSGENHFASQTIACYPLQSGYTHEYSNTHFGWVLSTGYRLGDTQEIPKIYSLLGISKSLKIAVFLPLWDHLEKFENNSK